VRRRSEKYVVSFHLNWVLGPFVHGRLQILQTSEVTFAHVITPLRSVNTSEWISVRVKILTNELVFCPYVNYVLCKWPLDRHL